MGRFPGLFFKTHTHTQKQSARAALDSPAQRLGLSMEDPSRTLETPEVVGGLKTRLFEGPKSIGSL